VGEWRRERGEETEEEVVEKKVERFWIGDFGSNRGAPVTGSGSRAALVG
jgi:hypothetical protein